MAVGFIGATIPAKVLRVSGTTLFQVAMMETGDAMQWAPIAQLNNLVDPWINAQVNILIPPVFPSHPQILPAIASPAISVALIGAISSPSTPPPLPPPLSPLFIDDVAVTVFNDDIFTSTFTSDP